MTRARLRASVGADSGHRRSRGARESALNEASPGAGSEAGRDDVAANDVLVEVLVPVYNGAETIRSSLASIQHQTESRIRLVVVDDGSTDDTPEILGELATQDRRIHVVTTANGGIVHALNTGLRHCIAPFIARHDADDIAFPERLARQLAYLRACPDVVAVGANAWHIDKAGRRIGSRTYYIGEPVPDAYAAHSVEPYLMHPFLLARRPALEAAGGYRYVTHSEDTDLYWRLLGLGRLFSLPDILGEYRVHAGSLSGASVVNGRIAAIESQVSAVSHRRRCDGRSDLVFSRDRRARMEQADSFAGVFAVAAEDLDAAEAAYLELAAAVKFLSLLTYRPYRATDDDLRFVTGALARHGEMLTARNRRDADDYAARLGIQLLASGRIGQYRIVRPRPVRVVAMMLRQARRSLYLARTLLRHTVTTMWGKRGASSSPRL